VRAGTRTGRLAGPWVISWGLPKAGELMGGVRWTGLRAVPGNEIGRGVLAGRWGKGPDEPLAGHA